MTTARTARRKAARLARWSSPGGDLARLVAPHLWLTATAEQRLDASQLASSADTTNQHVPATPDPPSPTMTAPRQIPIEPAAPTALHLPRFRALALFRRLPSARVDGVSSRRPKTCT